MVTFYTKANCPDCFRAKMEMEIRSISFKEISLDENPELVKELQAEGFRQMPVIKGPNGSFTGYNREKILALA